MINTNFMPPGMVSNLQEVFNKKPKSTQEQQDTKIEQTYSLPDQDFSKPIILVTSGEGFDSPGLICLVEALVQDGSYNVHVCAPKSGKSFSGHSLTFGETVSVSSAEIKGATAYEVSGTPVDCVSLALSGALFSWSKPLMIISGINKGSSCGYHMFYSGGVAAAREALISGIPSISVSLNWKKDESQESTFKDAAIVCLPLIKYALRDIENGIFTKGSLSIEIPTSPLTNKGFKLTKQSIWRLKPCWQAASVNRRPSPAPYMSNQQAIGFQLAQLGRDASAAGAARRITTQKKYVEVESVGASEKTDPTPGVKKNFRLEFLEMKQEDVDEDLDFRALENGFITVTPFSISSLIEGDVAEATANWISTALNEA